MNYYFVVCYGGSNVDVLAFAVNGFCDVACWTFNQVVFDIVSSTWHVRHALSDWSLRYAFSRHFLSRSLVASDSCRVVGKCSCCLPWMVGTSCLQMSPVVSAADDFCHSSLIIFLMSA